MHHVVVIIERYYIQINVWNHFVLMTVMYAPLSASNVRWETQQTTGATRLVDGKH